MLDPGEACDDGNQRNTDDCRVTCERNACGDGYVDSEGPDLESCDDGNREHFDSCPSDCRVEFCAATGAVREVTIVTSTPDLASIILNLDYPEGKVNLVGTGTGIPPGTITPAAGTAQGNDFDHALRFVMFDAFNFGTTSIATIQFDDCDGAVPPTPAEFGCTVEQAGDESFQPVAGVTCSVTIP